MKKELKFVIVKPDKTIFLSEKFFILRLFNHWIETIIDFDRFRYFSELVEADTFDVAACREHET